MWLLRKRPLLKIPLQGIIILFISIQPILGILAPNPHLKLQLNPPMKHKNVQIEHLLHEQSVISMHHRMRIRYPILLPIKSHVIRGV